MSYLTSDHLPARPSGLRFGVTKTDGDMMRCFVMMPYDGRFRPIRESIRAAAQRVGILCVLADELPDPGRITDKVCKEIWNSRVCVCDLTGRNPNVVWELGYAQALGKPCICLAASENELFFDIKDETTIVYGSLDLPALLHKLTEAFRACVRNFGSPPPPEELFGTDRHESTTRVLAARRVAETPYALLSLLERAVRHVFIAGQNHYYWVETPERQSQLKAAIERFLRRGVNYKVDIMLCDNARKYRHAVRTWQHVCASRYSRDLNNSLKFFRSLHDWANSESDLRGRLTIKKVAFVPTSMTFMDPEEENLGLLVLTPNGYEERSRNRPCFIISRKINSEIFMSYWGTYSQRFHDIEGSNIAQEQEVISLEAALNKK